MKSKVISVQRKNLIEVYSIVGEGTEDDPVRKISQYFMDDGSLLATNDPVSLTKIQLQFFISYYENKCELEERISVQEILIMLDQIKKKLKSEI